MIKFFLIVIIVVGLVIFTVPGQRLMANILDAISPVTQEKQLLTGLQKNIDGISTTINRPEFQKLSDTEKLKQLNTFVEQAKSKVKAVQEALKQGDISATVSMLIQKVAGLKTNDQIATSSSTPNNCPH